MKNKIRKTDSLAYATGTFLNSLELFQERWNEATSQIKKEGPIIIEKINRAISSPEKSDLKNGIIKSLSSLGSLFTTFEKIYADQYVLMTEIDGLEFPIKTAQELLEQCKVEEAKAAIVRNVVQNLSKTISFYNAGNSDLELIKSSLKSFEEEFSEYKNLIEKSEKLLKKLSKELNDEHDKAKKYSDRF
ncbi:MAG: hypothetical protein ACTSQE_00875 [Candidatus Heimdallarchaeaceae archaeon]